MTPIPRSSETEWEVMKVVWAHVPLTSAALIVHLPAQDPTWHPKTVRPSRWANLAVLLLLGMGLLTLTDAHPRAAAASGVSETEMLTFVPMRPPIVHETEAEFFVTGDFNGDGRTDVLVLSRHSWPYGASLPSLPRETASMFDEDMIRHSSPYSVVSLYRIAYQTDAGDFEWTRVHSTELTRVTGVTVGRLLAEDRDALAVTRPDADAIQVLDVSDPAVAPRRVSVIGSAPGPSAVVALPPGADRQPRLHDLVTAAEFPNAPVEHAWEILRPQAGGFQPLSDLELEGQAVRANAVVLGAGARPVVAAVIPGEASDTFQAVAVVNRRLVEVLRVPGLPKRTQYVVGRFGSSQLATLLFYVPGAATLSLHSLSDAGQRYRTGPEQSLALDDPVRSVVVLGEGDRTRLLVIHGRGERASILSLDPQDGLRVQQTIAAAEDEAFSGALCLGDRFMMLLRRPNAWSSTFSQVWRLAGDRYLAGETVEMTTIDIAVHEIEPVLRANARDLTAATMKPYTQTIPGTQVTYRMVPIPGGEFFMGTPPTEPNRADNEGPQVRVTLDPFWMQTTEVTWEMYDLFVYGEGEWRRSPSGRRPTLELVGGADAVTRPSSPYTEMDFGMGREGFPAIAMTHYAANKFCQWLSARTGHYYRLPTEAEWEYACRAGSTTAYSFGDNADALDAYAVYEQNSYSEHRGGFVYARVGTKKPNAWGLYDMHGNVMEWCLDGLGDYSLLGPKAINPWVRPTKPYPHVVRGGSYDCPAEWLRSGARRGSQPQWKESEPMLPKSFFWLSDISTVGFRIVRPLTVPEAEELARRWNPGTEHDLPVQHDSRGN
jgi:formylglycine-generating enzyme required for sulfatase activity